MTVVAIGTAEFLMGFTLAGLTNTVLSTRAQVRDAIQKNHDAKVIILDEELLQDLDSEERNEIETLPSPVIITLGSDDTVQQERLKRSIKSTLGVDLL